MMIRIGPNKSRNAKRSKRSTHSVALAIGLVVLFVASIGLAARAAWEGPTSGTTAPFDFPAGFVLPLNTSAVDQTKTGALSLGGTTTANAGLIVGTGGGSTRICWNGVCRSSWTTAGSGSFVRLQTGAFSGNDVGNVLLTGTNASITPITLRGVAKDTGNVFNPGVGIEGIASNSNAGFSAGVAGNAAVNWLDHYGIYASNGGSPIVPAADFAGHVSLEGGYDLVIGVINSSVTAARANGIPEICLNGSCKSAWEIGGRSEWAVFAGTTSTLWPNSSTRSVSVGNGTFTVIPYVNSTVDLTVSGDAEARHFVIGTPTSYLSGKTCGDRVCNLNETAVSCALDCDTIAPDRVPLVDAVTFDTVLNEVRIDWLNPSSAGFAGTRVVWKVGTNPANPSDGTERDVAGVAGGSSMSIFSLDDGTFCFNLFTYDVDGNGSPLNFSDGVESFCATL